MEGLTQNEKIVWSCWETKTLREVVREAAAKGTHIALAHRFLQFKQSWDVSTTDAWFTAEVFAWVLQLLSRKQFFKASHVLNKMQISPPKYMLNVAKESLDNTLRDYIIDQLMKTANDLQKDAPEEWKVVINHWNLLQLLEKSFDTDGTMKQTRVFGVGKDLCIVTSSEVKVLTIQKINTYPDEWKRKVASYLFLEILDFSIIDFLEPEYLWNILLLQNKAMLLRRWIAMYYSKEKHTTNESLQSDIRLLKVDVNSLDTLDKLKQLDGFLLTWAITPEMILSASTLQCYDFTKLCVHDTLCSYGHVKEEEKKNLQSILLSLSRTQNLGNMDKLFSRGTSTVSKTDLNNMLVKYCIDNDEYHTMTTCVDYSLLENANATSGGKYSPTCNCLDLWLLFKEAANGKETGSYIAAIYETCKYVSENNMDKYFADNPSLLLALIIFDGQKSIFEIFNDEQCLSLQNATVKWEKPFHQSLPHLYSVFQKFTNNLLVIENDVNVYQLLSGYNGLDISKVFEFQLIEKSLKAKKRSNTFPQSSMSSVRKDATNNADNYEEMPHFANRKLVRKHGFQKRLNYMYYLRQNRPCMASQALLIQQYQRFGRLSPKIINEACMHAHTLALQNWNDSVITGCCIAFISMIGGDSIKCRTHITCANLVANFLEIQQGTNKEEVSTLIDKAMHQLTTNDREGQLEILDLAEKASMLELLKISGAHSQSIDISKILHKWQSVVRFAHFHNLPVPESSLQILVAENLWIAFLIFGDVFKYSRHTMLSLSRGFSSLPLVEHFRHAISHQLADEQSNREGTKQQKDELRKSSRGSADMNCTPEVAQELEFSLMGDIWEVMANCHGPEDPPGALLRASAALHCPILALLATCYEPDAVDICWTQWVLSSMKIQDPQNTFVKQWDPSGMKLSDNRVIRLMEMCLEAGFYKTLLESLTIFYRESPLCTLMKFILQTVLYFDFGADAVNLLKTFNNTCGRRMSVMGRAEGSWLPRLQRMKFVQTASITLVVMAMSKGFKSLSHQKSFLQLLCDTHFSKNFSVPHPDFCKIAALLKFSVECNILLDLGDMCGDNAKHFQKQYLENLVESKMYEKALEFAKVVDLPIEHILIADWTERYKSLNDSSDNTSQESNEQSSLLFWARCSLTFRETCANPIVTVEFLKKQCDDISDNSHKFYILRLILYWFNKLTEDALAEMSFKKDTIEFEMWIAYLNSENDSKLQLLGEDATYDYILKEKCNSLADKNADVQIVFRKLLNEIEQDSNVNNMSITGWKLSIEETNKWCRSLGRLLECGLVEEAWRLSKMFSAPQGYSPRTLYSVQLVESCLRLAEGTMNAYELPHSLRLLVASSSSRFRLSDSQCSDNSFEELVLIPDKQEEPTESNSHVVGRQEADCLSSLETLASKSGFRIVKQVASIYRVSLQIGWSYSKVLKYDGNPLELINYLSGRSRMPLAKIIFTTYEVPTQKIVEYLCLEIVGAVISPHLTRTSGFRQKEHFRYTLWGFPLDSDFEMFLNLRPDDNSMLGRMVLEHLTAFRKLYKTDGSAANYPNTDYTEVEDVEAILDEEYQNIDDYEVESVISQQSGSVMDSAARGTSIDSQSVVSESTLYTCSNHPAREKKPQYDVISCTNIRIKSSVKSNMKSLLKGAKLSSKQVNVISIELLVLAHECFSSVCDTEGIATALRSAQTLAGHLLAARSWRLLVRLLTGLARYTEMAYIFQMLRDNHQFEFLLGQFDYMLGQHQEKIASFKQGLLEFLKKHCPGDTEMYCLVALHFSMYSEAADVKKKQANDLIVTLTQIALDSMKVLKKRSNKQPEWIILANSDSNRLLLDTAINHCSDSAELYCKGGCLGAAREMAGLAQLLALQISLLSNPPTRCILNLPSNKMAIIIDSYLSFMEGLVFAHAVDGGGGGWKSRWRELVYQRILRGGDVIFLKDIATFRPDIACYIVERYENENKLVAGAEVISELRSFFK